jgi:AraC-like DNA-binding protein
MILPSPVRAELFSFSSMTWSLIGTIWPPRWTVEIEMMAADCGLKMTQFVHYVRQLTNMAPMHYLSHRRLDFAVRLLQEDRSVSVTELLSLPVSLRVRTVQHCSGGDSN